MVPEEGGFVGGYVKLESDDPLPADNRRFFTFYVPEEITVYLTGDPEQVRAVSLALEPDPDAEYAAHPVILDSPELLANYPEAQVLYLAGVSSISSYAARLMERLLERGGGILIAPSSDTDVAELNRELLQPLNAPQYGELRGNIGSISWGNIDMEHPLFQGIFGEQAQVQSPEFFRYFQLPGPGTDIIEFRNGDSYLREISFGSGSMLLFSAGFSRQWTDITHRGIFAPLMHRAAVYLGGRSGGC